MAEPSPRRVEELFDLAIDLDPARRAAFLDEQCAGDAGLRAAVEKLLQAAQAGEPGAAERLLAVVYEELHRLARARMAHLPPGQTLQPTALVHEAYLRLAGRNDLTWESRRDFFITASRGMRDILVEQARRKAGPVRGGPRQRAAPWANGEPCKEGHAPAALSGRPDRSVSNSPLPALVSLRRLRRSCSFPPCATPRPPLSPKK